MGRLLLLFIVIPVVELILLIEIGQRVGTLVTIGLIMTTGVIGASLARHQGINTMARLRADLEAGQLPTDPIIDGMLILIAAAVLMTPGVLTDLFGFVCLVPTCRQWLKHYVKRRFEQSVREGRVSVSTVSVRRGDLGVPIKNVTPPRSRVE